MSTKNRFSRCNGSPRSKPGDLKTLVAKGGPPISGIPHSELTLSAEVTEVLLRVDPKDVFIRGNSRLNAMKF
jgi:hypothetical protein